MVSWRRSAWGTAAGGFVVEDRAGERGDCLVPGTPLRRRAGLGFPIASNGVPHSRQNLVEDRFAKPHCGQRVWVETPHSPQNFVPSGLSEPQLSQRMGPLYPFGLYGATETQDSLCQATVDYVATLATFATLGWRSSRRSKGSRGEDPQGRRHQTLKRTR